MNARVSSYALVIGLGVTVTGCLNDSSSSGSRHSPTFSTEFDDSHYLMVRRVDEKIAHVQLFNSQSGRKLMEAFPYGTYLAHQAGDAEQLTPSAFQEALYDAGAVNAPGNHSAQNDTLTRRIPSTRRTASSLSVPDDGYASFGLGYDATTGYLPNSDCYNFTVVGKSADRSQTDLSAEQAANSESGQLNISSSISGSYNGLVASYSASAEMSYSDQWAASTNSGEVLFSAYTIADYSVAYVADDPFNDKGLNQIDGNTFDINCGTQFVSTVPAGAMVMARFSWETSSSSTATSIESTVSASYESLSTSMEAAVSIASDSAESNESASMDFHVTVIGGGSVLQSAVSAALTSSSLDSCISDQDSAACATFATSFSTATSQGLADFYDTYLAEFDSSGNDNPSYFANSGDMSAFHVFSSGIAGTSETGISDTTSAPSTAVSIDLTGVDPKYLAPLESYLTIFNQMYTLKNRSDYLYDKVSLNTDMSDLDGTLGITNNLSQLSGVYGDGLDELQESLSQCLEPDLYGRDTAIAVCDAIQSEYDQGIVDAYDWLTEKVADAQSDYDAAESDASTSIADLKLKEQTIIDWNMALQNSIALQYVGTTSVSCTDSGTCGTLASDMAHDVYWLPGLPTGISPPSGWNENDAVVVVIVDAPWVDERGNASNDVAAYLLNNPDGDIQAFPYAYSEQSSMIYGFGSDGNQTLDTGESLTIDYDNVSTCVISSIGQPCPINATSNSGYPGTLKWHKPYQRVSEDNDADASSEYTGSSSRDVIKSEAFVSVHSADDPGTGYDAFSGSESGTVVMAGFGARTSSGTVGCLVSQAIYMNKPASRSTRTSKHCSSSSDEEKAIDVSDFDLDGTNLITGLTMTIVSDNFSTLGIETNRIFSRYNGSTISSDGEGDWHKVGSNSAEVTNRTDDGSAIVGMGVTAHQNEVARIILYFAEVYRSHSSGVADFEIQLAPINNFFE
jgi:hypothetical protein